jgi:hypothetical protein
MNVNKLSLISFFVLFLSLGMSHLQKQRLMNKYEGNMPFNAGNQNRMHNNPSFSVEDDLGEMN